MTIYFSHIFIYIIHRERAPTSYFSIIIIIIITYYGLTGTPIL